VKLALQGDGHLERFVLVSLWTQVVEVTLTLGLGLGLERDGLGEATLAVSPLLLSLFDTLALVIERDGLGEATPGRGARERERRVAGGRGQAG
jgi:hypothetical protein